METEGRMKHTAGSRWWPAIGGICALLVLVTGCSDPGGDADRGAAAWMWDAIDFEPAFELGGTAPDFPLVHVGGSAGPEEGVLSELRGEVLLLDFWGSGCAGCIREHPALVELAARYRDRGVRTFGITEDSSEEVQGFEERYGSFGYPILADDGAVADLYGILGWPTKVIVDPDGRVVWWRPGGPLPEGLVSEALDSVLAGLRPPAGARSGWPEQEGDLLLEPRSPAEDSAQR